LLAALTAAISSSMLLLVAPAGAGAAPRPVPMAETSAADVTAAVKAAKQSGERVEALSERTEYSQVFAEPSGSLTYEATAVPQRVRKTDGSWTDIDTDLVPDGDTLRPTATLADVRFSTGGTGPLVTWRRNGKDLTVSWPLGALPRPSVTEDSATYSSVLPDVDLIVRATRTGFTHVLVVKTITAAANPAVRELRFGLGGDARVRRLPDGMLQAVADGRLIASAGVPQMWDSTDPANGSAKVTRSTQAAPGDAARVAELGTTIDDNGDLVLRPDPAVLAKATFPVFIDPEWSTAKSRWAYATHNNTNNADTSVARVGADPDGRTYRSFFEFPTTAIKGKYVASAYVQMEVDHSYSCTDTPNSMYQSAAVGSTPRTSYSTSLTKYLTSASSHANEGSGCSDSPQPNMTVNFTGSSVTSAVNSVAGAAASAITFAFTARDSDGGSESDGRRWKKYLPSKAKLIATVDAKPGAPSSLQVNGVACGDDDTLIGSTTPYFSAYLPDADGTQQTLQATWTLYKADINDDTLSNPVTLPITSTTANTRGSSARIAAHDPGRYAFTVKSTDPFTIVSPPSKTCYFQIDTTVPDVAVTVVSGPEGPGKPVQVKFTSAAQDVTEFRYGWNDAVPYQVAATPIKDSSGKVIRNEATATLTTAGYGIAVVYARALDQAGNFGSGSGPIVVPRPSPALAQWGLEATPVTDQTSAMLDQQPALAGDNQLTGPTSWTDKGRIVGAKNLTFTGTSALTTPKFLDTIKSFAVAAWVKLDNVNGVQTVLSQDGANVANFQLGLRPDDLTGDGVADRSWCFGVLPSDSTSASYVGACAIDAAAAGRWTHVAGTYDATTKRLQIWVDGKLMGDAAAPTAWAADGPLRIGNRKTAATTYGDGLTGGIADVQVFDRVLVLNDFTGTRADEPLSNGIDEPGILSPSQVGRWDFETAWPCIDTTEPSSCLADDTGTGWNERFRFTPGTSLADGNGDIQSMAFDNVLSEDNPQATTEYGISQRNVGTNSAPQWQDSPVMRTDYSFSVSVWVKPARLANMTAVAQRGSAQSAFYLGARSSKVGGVTGTRFEVMIPNTDQATGQNYNHLLGRTVLTDEDLNQWWHLTFVYDTASNTQLRLYVNDKLESSRAGTMWPADGALTIGGGWSTPAGGTGAITDQWFGSIDNLDILQGVAAGGAITPDYPDMAIRDFNGDQFGDVLARDSAGVTYLYGGDGQGGFTPRTNTGGSFAGYNLVLSPRDFDGDGNPDLFGRTTAGKLMLHRGNGNGGWLNTTGIEVGSGFDNFTAIITPGDFNGDGNADLIGRTLTGDLLLYAGNGKGSWTNGRGLKIGAGFQGFDMLFSPGDFTGDGFPDLMARRSTGELYYYAGNGNGGWLTGWRVQAGSGFNAFNLLFSPGDFNGDGNPDVIGRDSNGNLKIYAGNGSGHWINNHGIAIGTGWNSFNAIF
jgi:hypothetical protein